MATADDLRDRLAEAPVEDAVDLLFPDMDRKRKEEIVLYLHSGGVRDTQEMKENWTTERLHEELCVPKDAENGLLPPLSYSQLHDDGLIIFNQATGDPSRDLPRVFSEVSVGDAVEVGEFWYRLYRHVWEEDAIFDSFRRLLDEITRCHLPVVKYRFSMELPQHKYWFARHATVSFYTSNPERHVWKLVVTEDERRGSLLTSLAGLALSTKEMFRQQPGRRFAVGAVFTGWGNQLVLCKFVRSQFLPVESTLPLVLTSRASGKVVLGLKLLIQLMSSLPDAFGFHDFLLR